MAYYQNGSNESSQLNSNLSNEQLLNEIVTRIDSKKKNNMGTEGSSVIHNNADKYSIDFKEIFYFLLSRFYWIILCMILGAVIFALYGAYYVVPNYSATSKLYVIGRNENNSILTNLQIGSWLTWDYKEVFKTWEVSNMVNEQLGTDFSDSQLQGMLKIENPESTNVLYITIKNPDAQMATDIANAYVKAAEQFITQTMETYEPKVFSLAQVPTNTDSKGTNYYITYGALYGAILAIAVLLLIFYLDNRPKSADDIMRYANIPTLAIVPHTKKSENKSQQENENQQEKKE